MDFQEWKDRPCRVISIPFDWLGSVGFSDNFQDQILEVINRECEVAWRAAYAQGKEDEKECSALREKQNPSPPTILQE